MHAGGTLKVRFSDISSQGNRYEISEVAGIDPGRDFSLCSPVHATCVLTRKSTTRVVLQGSVQAEVELVCDRCAAVYGLSVDRAMQLILEVPDALHWQLREIECSGTDLDTLMLREPVIDLEDIFRQQLYLSLPIKRLCRTDCRGMCPGCGADLNVEACRCSAQTDASPFAVLAGMKLKR